MISKGDFVKLRFTLAGGSDSGDLREMVIFGKMMNYADEQEIYIFEPKTIVLPKDQVVEADELSRDFDFENIADEISLIERQTKRELAPDIRDIRISREE